MTTRPSAITVRDLTRRFGAFVAVNQVSFDVHEGEIFGYLGANGAGKSTTIRMLCGLLAPTSGTATVAGVDVGQDPEAVKRRIGYMSQKFSLYADLLAQENLQFFGGAYGLSGRRLRERVDTVLREVGLTDQRTAVTGALPGGWRQRLALACSILHQPRVLFLDEPTAGVDPLSRRTFWDLVRRLAGSGTTILVTTHYMDEAEYCDRVGLMVDGRLAALDTPEGLKRTHVPGRTVAVRGVTPAEMDLVPSWDGVVHVEPFGAGYHVRVRDDPDAVTSLRHALTRHVAGPCDVEEIEATLEDVFLEVVRTSSGGQTAAVEG
jgi:ABC-2 type transport system ATP-binding protein